MNSVCMRVVAFASETLIVIARNEAISWHKTISHDKRLLRRPRNDANMGIWCSIKNPKVQECDATKVL